MGKRRRRKTKNIKNRVNLKGNFCFFFWEGEIESILKKKKKNLDLEEKNKILAE
jgi:transcription elongation factor Elf1